MRDVLWSNVSRTRFGIMTNKFGSVRFGVKIYILIRMLVWALAIRYMVV